MALNSLGPETLGEALCLLRRRAGIGRNDLAGAAGVSGGALSAYENDASIPSAAVLRRLARALAECLNCDVNDLWVPLGDLLDGPLASRSRTAARRIAQRLTTTD